MKVKVIGYGTIVVLTGVLQAIDSQHQEDQRQNGYSALSQNSCVILSPQPRRARPGFLPDTKKRAAGQQLTTIIKNLGYQDRDFVQLIFDHCTLDALVEQLVSDGYDSNYLQRTWYYANPAKRDLFIALLKAKICRFVAKHWRLWHKEVEANRLAEQFVTLVNV